LQVEKCHTGPVFVCPRSDWTATVFGLLLLC
jgi:hypothetical protein